MPRQKSSGYGRQLSVASDEREGSDGVNLVELHRQAAMAVIDDIERAMAPVPQ